MAEQEFNPYAPILPSDKFPLDYEYRIHELEKTIVLLAREILQLRGDVVTLSDALQRAPY